LYLEKAKSSNVSGRVSIRGNARRETSFDLYNVVKTKVKKSQIAQNVRNGVKVGMTQSWSRKDVITN
jgi:hypothetical protein